MQISVADEDIWNLKITDDGIWKDRIAQRCRIHVADSNDVESDLW